MRLSFLRADRSLSISALDLLRAGSLDVTVSLFVVNRAKEVDISIAFQLLDGKDEWKQHTFFAGLPSIVPTAFSTTPFTLSVTVGFLLFLVAGAFFFSTRPAVAALARGLDVFAFVLGTLDFLEVDLGLGATSSMAKSTRGVLFFRSPGRLPSRTSFVFAIAGGWGGQVKKMRSLRGELIKGL